MKSKCEHKITLIFVTEPWIDSLVDIDFDSLMYCINSKSVLNLPLTLNQSLIDFSLKCRWRIKSSHSWASCSFRPKGSWFRVWVNPLKILPNEDFMNRKNRSSMIEAFIWQMAKCLIGGFSRASLLPLVLVEMICWCRTTQRLTRTCLNFLWLLCAKLLQKILHGLLTPPCTSGNELPK